MPDGALDVRAHQRGGPLAVARLERREDRAVLLDVVDPASPPSRRRCARSRRPTSAIQSQSRSFVKPGFRVAAATAKWNARLASWTSSEVARRARPSIVVPHQLKIRVGAACGGEPAISGSSARRASSRWRTSSRPDLGDEEAAVDLEVDEAVAREAPQGLPHRAARDPEPVGQLALTEARARRERARDDQGADLVVGEPDDRADAERAAPAWAWSGRIGNG